MFSICLIMHSHKKWKDSVEGSLVLVIFMAELVPMLPQNISIVNIERTCKSKQMYYLCDQLLGALMYLHFINLFLIDYVWCRLCNKCLLLFENNTRQEYDTGEKTLLQLLHKGKLKTKFCIFVDYSY